MSTIAFDQFALTRIADSPGRCRSCTRPRGGKPSTTTRSTVSSTRSASPCGATRPTISATTCSPTPITPALNSLDEAHARIFAAEQGYDLIDDDGMLSDWWGYCWMILAEKRGLLTPENRAAARAQIEEKYPSAPT